MLTVKDLKQMLENYNDDDVVIVAEGGETYSPLDGIEDYIYVPETTWWGSIYLKELTPDLIAHRYSEEDLYDGDDGHNAIILCPVH